MADDGGERMGVRGRSCPLAYRYRPEALAQPSQLSADTLYVVGGLYGNLAALRAVLQRAEREPGGPAVIVFNGDAHWLDVDPEDFRTIGETVLAHHATSGNVEAELASDEDAGCGCAYPDYVEDAVVDRSNLIIDRLRTTARRFPDLVGRLGGLPRYLTASVGRERVGILHGDPESLAGWRLALEAMEPGDPAVRRQAGWRGRPTTPVFHPPGPRHAAAAGAGRARQREVGGQVMPHSAAWIAGRPRTGRCGTSKDLSFSLRAHLPAPAKPAVEA